MQRADSVQWLKDNALALHSIDPFDTDFSDLEAFAATLKDVRVVLLGEISHGDGSSFLAKTRLIKWLHQTQGFDALAFESGFYDCKVAWQAMQHKAPLEAFRDGVFGVWSNSVECLELAQYLGIQAKSSNPLELLGFDCQLTGRASKSQLCNDLEGLRQTLKLELDNWDVYILEIQRLADWNWYDSPPSLEHFKHMMLVHQQFSEACAVSEIEGVLFWRQLLDSIQEYLIMLFHDKDQPYDPRLISNERDLQMAKNLLWHLEQHPKRRFIVWAANAHIARAAQTITVESGELISEAVRVMGSHLYDILGKQMCSIAVLGYQGEMARYRDTNPQQLQPQSDNLESLCAEAGLENALWNLRASPFAGQTMNARFGGEKNRFFADWSQIFDVILFTKNVTRSHSAVPL